MSPMKSLGKLLAVCLIVTTCGCGYRFGHHDRRIPGGFERVAIPVFDNTSMEVNVENLFTNALRLEFERSNLAQIVSLESADAVIKGKLELLEVEIDPNSRVIELAYLPSDTVLTTQYRIKVTVSLTLQSKKDRKTFWQGKISNEKVFSAAQVTVAGVNSANPLYNQSAKLENVGALARDMMAEAHDRITENF